MGCELGNYRTASLHTFICGGCPTAEQFLTKPIWKIEIVACSTHRG